MTSIKIFLASSFELREDRLEFEIFIQRFNQSFHNKDIFVQLIIWEDFIDAVSKTRLQDEYNKKIVESDIFIMLFFTKVGMYTEEEFNTALNSFKQISRPLIYTYFKTAPIEIGSLNRQDTISLLDFKDRLKQLGHFYTEYKNPADLINHFRSQLTRLLDDGFFKSKRLDFEPILKATIGNQIDFCRSNNVFLYTTFLLQALLQIPESYGFSCLSMVRKGYPERLLLKYEDFIKHDLLRAGRGAPYVESDIFEREDVKKANDLALKDSSLYITQKHLLLGILSVESSTVKMLKQDLSEQWDDFIMYVKFNKSNNETPYN